MSERALPMKSTLLPCPFCGCKEHRWGNEGDHIKDGYEVRCCGCPAETWGPTREEAEAAWNARKPQVAPPVPNEPVLLRKMAAHGGAFAQALAAAWLLADPHNAACLRASFGGMLQRYEAAPNSPEIPESSPSIGLRFQVQGGHTHVDVFVGKTSASRGRAGTLVLENREWEAIRRTLPASVYVEERVIGNLDADHPYNDPTLQVPLLGGHL